MHYGVIPKKINNNNSFIIYVLLLLKNGVPFNAHSCECQDGADGRDILHVVYELAEEYSESPRVGKQLGQLVSYIYIFLYYHTQSNVTEENK